MASRVSTRIRRFPRAGSPKGRSGVTPLGTWHARHAMTRRPAPAEAPGLIQPVARRAPLDDSCGCPAIHGQHGGGHVARALGAHEHHHVGDFLRCRDAPHGDALPYLLDRVVRRHGTVRRPFRVVEQALGQGEPRLMTLTRIPLSAYATAKPVDASINAAFAAPPAICWGKAIFPP